MKPKITTLWLNQQKIKYGTKNSFLIKKTNKNSFLVATNYKLFKLEYLFLLNTNNIIFTFFY